MEDKNFQFTDESAKKMFLLKFENDWLFKKKKQPWSEFREILLQNGFPEEMTVSHIRKKWGYTYDMYKIAKRARNRSWKYYKIFNKYLGKAKILDKYEAWDDEWRLKLITCISEAKKMKVDMKDLWRTVEMAMRCQNLPLDCCIQDIKKLWRHIRLTFNRKYRAKYDKDDKLSDWPLYEIMFDYFAAFEPGHLASVLEEGCDYDGKGRRARRKVDDDMEADENVDDFHWTKDITETFIQLRLQNDHLFRTKKWQAWNELVNIMIEEYGFPRTLTGREVGRKWASTYRIQSMYQEIEEHASEYSTKDYQKAKATNNKLYVYYDLFELYLGEGNLSLNPTLGWTDESLFNLITARTEMEHLFRHDLRDDTDPWREVEKRLRIQGLPLDHSLLDLPEIWTFLVKTFRWKKKFAAQGILTENWAFFDAMERYTQVKENVIKAKEEKLDRRDSFDEPFDDEFEDNMKLLDLKQKLQVKPKLEFLEGHQCRSCSSEDGCINIYEQIDSDGLNLAEKLKMIGGVEVNQSDTMPSQICITCLQELESAYKFRRRCQETDKQNRILASQKVKLELSLEDTTKYNDSNAMIADTKDNEDHFNDIEFDFNEEAETSKAVKKERPRVVSRKKKVRKSKYDYRKICEICGKPTRNLLSHLDMHSTAKTYSCEICDKKFKFKSGLIIHKAVHDPTPRKTCEVCGKTFHIVAQYRRHFVYHANERKFECETCGKRFNTLDILRVHNRMHTDERPFSCTDCGKTFRTAGCVSRHKRIVHRVHLASQVIALTDKPPDPQTKVSNVTTLTRIS